MRALCRDMKVTESSESVLAGTKRPPFRLVCRAISMHGTRLPVQPAVSEEFVVRSLLFEQWKQSSFVVTSPNDRRFTSSSTVHRSVPCSTSGNYRLNLAVRTSPRPKLGATGYHVLLGGLK